MLMPAPKPFTRRSFTHENPLISSGAGIFLTANAYATDETSQQELLKDSKAVMEEILFPQ